MHQLTFALPGHLLSPAAVLEEVAEDDGTSTPEVEGAQSCKLVLIGQYKYHPLVVPSLCFPPASTILPENLPTYVLFASGCMPQDAEDLVVFRGLEVDVFTD